MITDVTAAKGKLAALSYFTLVSGYKEPLRDSSTRRYKPGVSFDDIVALYDFDDDLRDLFERAINRVELKLKSALSYAFCERYGEAQSAYWSGQGFLGNYSSIFRRHLALSRKAPYIRSWNATAACCSRARCI